VPREYPRALRLNVQLQRELSELIRESLSDPRIGLMTVTGVSVSPDMRNARVLVSSFNADAQLTDAVKALNGASGRLRALLAKRLKLRAVPMLRFAPDIALREGDRISGLIRAAVANDRKSTPAEPDEEAGPL
jgi:ribosome-binding factor A